MSYTVSDHMILCEVSGGVAAIISISVRLFRVVILLHNSTAVAEGKVVWVWGGGGGTAVYRPVG